MTSSAITVAQSNAFVTTFDLSSTDSGPLDGLRFVVKDTIDVAGFKTGCGNPTWRDSHPDAVVHAVCIEQLLHAGARCVGARSSQGRPPGRSSRGSGYYPRTLSLTSVAGMGRMPQVSLPIATPAACLWGCRYWRGRDSTQSWRKWQRMLIEKQI